MTTTPPPAGPVTPLPAADPAVAPAMTVAEQLGTTEHLAFIRTVYRHAYAYIRTRDPRLLHDLACSVTTAVTLHTHPEYRAAVARRVAARTAVDEAAARPELARAVDRAMRVTAGFTPAQRDEFTRTLFRHLYAYRATADIDLHIALADGTAVTIALHADPDYQRAAAELDATTPAPNNRRTATTPDTPDPAAALDPA